MMINSLTDQDRKQIRFAARHPWLANLLAAISKCHLVHAYVWDDSNACFGAYCPRCKKYLLLRDFTIPAEE